VDCRRIPSFPGPSQRTFFQPVFLPHAGLRAIDHAFLGGRTPERTRLPPGWSPVLKFPPLVEDREDKTGLPSASFLMRPHAPSRVMDFIPSVDLNPNLEPGALE